MSDMSSFIPQDVLTLYFTVRGVTCPVHLHAKTVVVTQKRVNVLSVKMDILARHATSVSTDVDIQNQIHSIISFIMQFTCQYYNNSYIILSLKKNYPMVNILSWVKVEGWGCHTDTYVFPCCILAHLESASKLHF